MGSAPELEPRPGRLPHHFPALDGLRGVAVAGVLAFHVGHLEGGYLGVDLFFVLSGYLITSLLVVEWAATGTVSLTGFWARRARRLLPALLAVLVAVGIASRWFVPPVSRGQLREEGVATLGYVANWLVIVRGNGYWQETMLPSWLEHTWSLAIEEQFYLLWPLIVAATWTIWRRRSRQVPPTDRAVRRGVTHLALLSCVGVIASAGLMIGLAYRGASTDRMYLGTDTRAAAILLGASLACVQYLLGGHSWRPRHRWLISVLGIAGAATLTIAWISMDGTGDALYRGGFLLCGIAATAVVLDITTSGASPLQRLLAFRPLRWLGLISYGLYLWHWPIFQYLRSDRFELTGNGLIVAQISVSLVVAVLSYRFLELPVRRGALRGRGVKMAGATAAAAAVVALLVGTMGAISPLPRATASSPTSGYTPGPKTAPRLIVIGDSVALTLGTDGLVPLARELGIRVHNSGIVGCTIIRDLDDPFNRAIRNCSPEWPSRIEKYRPDVVLVLFGGWMGVLPAKVDGEDVWPCDPAWQRRWAERLNDAVSTLSSTGAKVVLLSAPVPPIQILKGKDPPLFDKRQDCANDGIRDVATVRPEAGFVDLARFVCPTDDKCRERLNGTVLRNDGLHFGADGAEAISRWLMPRVLAAAELKAGVPG